jgi:hypothetical protein
MILALAALCCAAAAQKPEQFALRAPLQLPAADGLHALELNEAVYRAARSPALADLRVFNAKGEALPLALLPPLPAPDPKITATPVRLVALPAAAPARDAMLQDFALRIEKDGARALIELNTLGAPAPKAEGAGGYLLDLRALVENRKVENNKDLRGEIELNFASDAPDFTGRIELAGSDDLVNWRPLASGPLVSSRQFGDLFVRNRFAVNRPAAFVRVSWSGAVAPTLTSAQFIKTAAPPAALARATLAVARADAARTYLVEVPIALPIERLILRAPRDNQSVAIRLSRYDDAEVLPRVRVGAGPRRAPERWIWVVPQMTVFKLNRDGVAIENPPLPFTWRTSKLRIELIGEDGFGDDLPIVEAEWRPARFALAARAPGPYVVAAGLTDAVAGPTLDLRNVLSADDPSGARLASALWVASSGAASTEAAPALTGATPPKPIAATASSRLLLWAVLVLAVLALAYMAWRLAAQMKQAPVSAGAGAGVGAAASKPDENSASRGRSSS